MPEDSPLIQSLRTAVAAAPTDVPLRLHLAELLLSAGHGEAAVTEAAFALQHAPGDAAARELMLRAMGTPAPAPEQGVDSAPAPPPGQPAPSAHETAASPAAARSTSPAAEQPADTAPEQAGDTAPERPADTTRERSADTAPERPGNTTPERSADTARERPGNTAPERPRDAAPEQPAETTAGHPAETTPAQPGGFDWQAAEQEVDGIVQPRFVPSAADEPAAPLAADGGGDPGDADAWDVSAPGTLRLSDVGGMEQVKERLEAAFLAPLRNPELRRLYGKSLRGGLLLYGPPGCGKTFIARAVAGELGASFLSVSVNDVLDMWVGNSERNMHQVFETARRQAPCVVFLDELDALGAKRSRTQHSGMRNTVNQLLTELDGIDSAANEGVFVLAATNVPWDVDIALRRPGRLDRTLLVLPPDAPAREAILRYHLRERPVEGVDLGKVVKATDGFSGADLAHVCESAAEAALLDSARTGRIRMIGTKDLVGAAKSVVQSSEPWFASARNVAMFANEGGMYDDLVAYLKKRRKL